MPNSPANSDLLPTSTADVPADGIDLFAMVVAVLAEWRLMVLTAVTIFVILLGLIFSLKAQFVARSSFVPQAGRNETGGLASLFSTHGPGTLYIGLLQSRTVQDDVIQRLGLTAIFHAPTPESARDVLTGKSSFSEGVDTIVKIEVKDPDPQLAARIANAYLDALARQNEDMGLQQSRQTTSLFQSQLEQQRAELETAENALARTQKETGLVSPESQTQISLTTIASIRDRITTLQVQLSSLLESETEQNPQVQRIRSQIGQLQAQEHALEGSGKSPVGAAPAAGDMPQNNLDMQRAQRELKYHDVLVNSLANQFQAARMEEAARRSAFQVVDKAVPPEHKAWPPRKPFLALSFGASLFCGLLAVIGRLSWRRVKADPAHSAQMSILRGAFVRR